MRHKNKAEDYSQAILIANLVSYALGLKSQAIMAAGRGTNKSAKGRQLAMYLAHTALGWPISRVATAFDRDRSTVAHACQTVEYKRDDEAFDIWVTEIEDGLTQIIRLGRVA